MIAFDFTPLTTSNLVLFGVAFAVLYGLIAMLLQVGWLRPVPQQPAVSFVGSLLIGVVTLLSFVVLHDSALRIGLCAAAFLTLLIGVWDENSPLRPGQQFAWQATIAVVAVVWGWTIPYVSALSGEGIISLSTIHLGSLLLPGGLLAVGWLLLMMNAMNWLDGVDGLAPGVGVVALLALAGVSLLPSVQDSRTLVLALIGAGAVLAVLVWNFPPAKVYLGTSGSWFLGLYIGLVAIVGGGKIVTTLLVLALPVLDFGLVIGQRLLAGEAPWRSDTVRHLHHRLLAAGWSPRMITLAAIVVSALLGWLALLLQTQHKVIALAVTAGLLVVLVLRLVTRQTRVVE